MENENIKICSICGEQLDNDNYYTNDNDDIFCEECYTERYAICGGCNCELCTEHGEGYWCEDTGDYRCSDCVIQCEECGNEFGNTNNMHELANGHYICEHCREYNDYHWCDVCERLYHEDDLYYSDSEDGYLCRECQDNQISHGVMAWHGFNNWKSKKIETEKEPKFYIGTELEIDNKTNENESQAVQLITKNLDSVCERDSSLSSYGFEIISHPLSYKYIMSRADIIKDTFEQLQSLGYKSHDTSCCGLHIHVTRPSDEVIDRIIFIMETYKNEIEMFSRRANSTYARFWSSNIIDKEHLKALCKIKNIKNDFSHEKYMALNLQHNNTIEFRIFKGTLRAETYLASIEFVNNLVTLCSDLKKPLSAITWEELTKTKYAKNYCELRGIYTNVVPYDISDLILKKEIKELKQKNKLKELVKKCIKRKLKKAINDYNYYLNNDYSKTRDLQNYVVDSNDAFKYIANWCRDYANFIREELTEKELEEFNKIILIGGEQ